MKKFVVFAAFGVFLAATSLSLPAEAEWGQHGGLDISFATGVNIGTDGRTGGIPAMFRFVHERVMLGLELNVMVPYGIGANVLFYVYNGPRFAIHVIDPGVFYSWADGLEISAPSMPRALDISAGLGAEIRVNDWLAVTVDWRTYLANPFRVMSDYADYGIRSFIESLKGGQLCVGLSLALY